MVIVLADLLKYLNDQTEQFEAKARESARASDIPEKDYHEARAMSYRMTAKYFNDLLATGGQNNKEQKARNSDHDPLLR